MKMLQLVNGLNQKKETILKLMRPVTEFWRRLKAPSLSWKIV